MNRKNISDIIVKQLYLIKYLLPTLLLLCSFIPEAAAQFHKPNDAYLDKEYKMSDLRKKIDTSILEVFYIHSAYDSILDITQSDNDILLIGNRFSYHTTYPAFRYDSAMLATFPEKCTNRDMDQVSNIFRHGIKTEYIKNLTDKTVTAIEQVSLGYSKHEEEIPQFQWTILPDTTTIGGYQCQKATAHFRGHTWEAWFTEELAIDNGPWKLNGLPGLILQAQTADGTHKYDFAGIRDGGNTIFRTDMRRHLLTREKMIKAQKEFGENGIAGYAITLAGQENNLPKRKRTFYAPLELE